MSSQYTVLMRDFVRALEIEHDFSNLGEPVSFEFEGVAYYLEAMPPQDDVLVYSFPGVLPAGGEDAMRSELLAANCFFRATGGATLAAAPGNNQVVLHKVIPVAGLETPGLVAAIEQFAVVTAFWTERLQAGAAQEKGAAPAGGGAEGDGSGFIRV